jgi:subtilisin-like proprotein convertase family protein
MIWTNDGLYRGARLGALLALALTACGDDGAVTSDTDEESTGTTEGPSSNTNPSTSASATSPSTTVNPSTTGMTSETETDPSSSTTMEEDTTTTTGDTDTTGPDIECGNDILEDGEECDGTDLGDETCVTQGADEGDLACAKDCTFDLSACVMYSCGNDILEGRELCDTDQLQDQTCEGLAFGGGTLACADNCMDYDTSGCYTCGDDTQAGPEVCDGTDVGATTCTDLGYDGGTVGCLNDCSDFDESGCYSCGDDTQEGPEVCDGTDLVGATCQSQGFVTGTLGCAVDCTAFDTTACSNTVCSTPGAVILPNAADPATVDTIDVASTGLFVTDVNVFVNIDHNFFADVEIDVRHVDTDTSVELGDDQCGSADDANVTFDADATPPVCSATPPTLGGDVQPLGNLDAFSGIGDTAGVWEITVNDDDDGVGGTLTEWCVEFEVSETNPVSCGDAVAQFGEVCDGAALNGATCASQAFDSGTLTCLADCSGFDTSGCGVCGDLVQNGDEDCDADDIGDGTCESLGFPDGGTLACNDDCTFDDALCTGPQCGDSLLEDPPEQCDSNELLRTRCEDLGFAGGALDCGFPLCDFDTSQCSDDVIVACATPAAAIVDSATVLSTLDLLDIGNVADIDVFVDITHTFDGDLDIRFRHVETNTTIDLSTDLCDASDDVFATFNDEGNGLADCVMPRGIEGNINGEGLLSNYDGLPIAGTWELSVGDDGTGDVGILSEWCVYITPE